MSTDNERMQILEMVEEGLISAAEGASLLQALDSQGESLPTGESIPEAEQAETMQTADLPEGIRIAEAPEQETEDWQNVAEQVVEDFEAGEATFDGDQRARNPFDQNIDRWRRWWMIPLWVGVGITILGALLMFLAFQATGASFWFGCAWLPFLLGLGVITMAWGSRTARWLHLRVQQKPGQRPQTIAISFPIPLRLMAWFVRTFRQRIPAMGPVDPDELLRALGDNTSHETPFYLEVDEGEDGERVQIYIG